MDEKQQILQAQRAYLKRWRQRNPDKVRAYQRRFWLKKAEETNEVNPGRD